MAVATFNGRTLAVKEKNKCGHAGCVLAKPRQHRCDFIGLQETTRSGQTAFPAAGYRVLCSGQVATEGRQGLYGVGLVVKESICRKSVYPHQMIDERLMSMRFELTVECAVVNLVVAYDTTEANPDVKLKEFFWKKLGHV